MSTPFDVHDDESDDYSVPIKDTGRSMSVDIDFKNSKHPNVTHSLVSVRGGPLGTVGKPMGGFSAPQQHLRAATSFQSQARISSKPPATNEPTGKAIFEVQYTHQKQKKSRAWQDGSMAIQGNSMTMYSSENQTKEEGHFSQQTLDDMRGMLSAGNMYEFETNGFLVRVMEERVGSIGANNSNSSNSISNMGSRVNTYRPQSKQGISGVGGVGLIRKTFKSPAVTVPMKQSINDNSGNNNSLNSGYSSRSGGIGNNYSSNHNHNSNNYSTQNNNGHTNNRNYSTQNYTNNNFSNQANRDHILAQKNPFLESSSQNDESDEQFKLLDDNTAVQTNRTVQEVSIPPHSNGNQSKYVQDTNWDDFFEDSESNKNSMKQSSIEAKQNNEDTKLNIRELVKQPSTHQSQTMSSSSSKSFLNLLDEDSSDDQDVFETVRAKKPRLPFPMAPLGAAAKLIPSQPVPPAPVTNSNSDGVTAEDDWSFL